jgi:hypothetical protein
MAKSEQLLIGDHKIKQNVQRKIILYIALYTVKTGKRFSRPQPGCHQSNSGQGEFG